MNMNLPNTTNGMAGEKKIAPAAAGFFRQIRQHGLFFPRLKMHSLDRAVKLASILALAASCLMLPRASAQTNYYSTNGTEYAVIGALPGDQVSPSAAVSTNGGYLVWADNATDGDSFGISARKLDATLSGTLGAFRVNVAGAGAQENPRVALLQNGGAVFVWQGGKLGFQHIYARFLNSSGVFIGTTDTLVNSSTNKNQINPAVTVLNNGNVVVVWSSFDQAGTISMQDVYGQMFAPDGTKIGGEFLVNQFTTYNQRSPAIAAQPNGGFIIAWVSEQQRILAPNVASNSVSVGYSSIPTPSVDVYARYYTAAGAASGNEFVVNTGNNPCATPALAVATDGSFLVAWCARDLANAANGLDVLGRTYNSSGTGGSVFYINERIYGDEYLPKVSAIGLDYLVTWTSLGQDGSREGVYGRFVHNNGAYNSGEFRINTTTASQQMEPCVAGNGASQFLVVWRSFTGIANGFDLYAQLYLNQAIGLPAISSLYVWSPFVISNNVYQPRLLVSWPAVQAPAVANYEVYVDGSATAAAIVTSNQWTMTAANGLTPGSIRSFQVDYVTTDARRSPLSPSVSGTNWSGLKWGSIPYEWMIPFYGDDASLWPSANSKIGGTGPTVYQVFLTGGSPLDSSTWLKQTMAKTVQGLFLNWNTTPGATYQIQQTTNLTVWSNFGSPRFAAGTTDSINVGGGSKGYYRILLQR